MAKKIGLFSGTFDPIHDGHIDFVQAARERFGLDEVLILVEQDPPRKAKISSFKDRLAMVKLAVADIPELIADKLPMQREGRNYRPKQFFDELADTYDDATQFFMILGSDLFEHMVEQKSHWPDRDLLYKKVSFVVGLRTEDDGETVVMLKSQLPSPVEMVVSPWPKVSSRSIRADVKAGQAPEHVASPVLKYIQEHKLYE